MEVRKCNKIIFIYVDRVCIGFIGFFGEWVVFFGKLGRVVEGKFLKMDLLFYGCLVFCL